MEHSPFECGYVAGECVGPDSLRSSGQMRALLDFARERLGITRFIAHCDAENAASYRVMEKLGMKRISVTGGRKNKAADGESEECTYRLDVQ